MRQLKLFTIVITLTLLMTLVVGCLEPTPTPSPGATEYQELPRFSYIGITSTPSEGKRLYQVL